MFTRKDFIFSIEDEIKEKDEREGSATDVSDGSTLEKVTFSNNSHLVILGKLKILPWIRNFLKADRQLIFVQADIQ